VSTPNPEDLTIKDALWNAVNTFTDLRKKRHEIGQEKYGQFTFLSNDVIRMMLEELADVANYVEYQAAKLILLQGLLEQDPRLQELTKEGEITIGMQAFKGTKEGWDKR
jgi:hypothetical protein